MPRQTPILLRPYKNPAKPHLKYRLPIPTALQPAVGVATKFFTTKREGDLFVSHLLRQQRKHTFAFGGLSPRDQADATHALELLLPHGITLTDAAKLAVEVERSRTASVTSRELEARYLDTLRADGLSSEHIRTAKSKLKRFADDFPGRNIASFTTQTINAWLRDLSDPTKTSRPLSPTTRNGVRTYVRAAFEFARKEGYVKTNPVTDTATAAVDGKAVSILTPDQLSRLLAAADPDMRIYFALGAFAGLRPSEIERLHWSDVNWDAYTIGVDTDNPRSYANRYVDVNDTLHAWLAPAFREVPPHPQDPAVLLTEQQINTRRREAALAAGIDPWPVDVLRHSFASYHLAHFHDLPKLVAQMGHADTKMISRHYRERVTPDAAAAWWAVRP